MNKTKRLKKIGFISILVLIILSFISNFDNIAANGTGPVQKFNTNLTLEEYSKFDNYIQNENLINVTLPSSSWSIRDIELNFTDIKFGKELIVIEDQNYTGVEDKIYYQTGSDWVMGLAIQIILTEPTTIYGVDLYGRREKTIPTTTYIQIRGYDPLNNKPNSTIYSSVGINMSATEGWYRQTFPGSTSLSPGNYFLVINCTSISSVNNYRYFWCYNDIDASYPSLYSSYYDQTAQWSTGIQNHIYLHKLIQKVETPVFPEEINMTVNIDNQLYSVFNSTGEGKGFLEKTVVDFAPNSDSYEIVVSNQASDSLLFNASFSVTFTKNLLTQCSVQVQAGTTNKWTLKPTIIRQPTNYSVLLNYPSSWENISVLRDEINITSSVIVDTTAHSVILLNDSITQGANWEIISYTPNIEFELNIQRTEYKLGQKIEFLFQTSLSGTYTFVFLDSAAVPVKNQTITYPPATIFSYSLNLTDLEGTYILYVFFFSASETNAGVQLQAFEISPPLSPSPEFPLSLIILIIALGIVALGLISYISLKRISAARRTKLEKFLSKCSDISNINDVIVIDSKSGIDVYSQSFGGRKLDTSLISGFLQAISNFGTTISEAAKESRTLTIEYKDSIVMQTDFVNLKLIVTLKENPSANFKFIMEDLAFDIFKHYGEDIDKFTGILKPFKNMKELIDKHLNTSFLFKLKIVENPKIKLSSAEKEMIAKAKTFMKENNFDHFYSLYLMPANACTPKDYQIIFSLIEKGIFKPIEEE